MEHWIVYDVATGEPRYRGAGPAGAGTTQPIADGLSLVVVPQAVIEGAELDLSVLRAAVADRIDAQAEQVRQAFLTPGAGQAMTYQRKEAEARAFITDPSTAVPFLEAEAVGRGISIADVAAEVISSADRWIAAGALIEGRRMRAKAMLAEATTFGAIVSVSRVDWSAANPQPGEGGAA